MLSFVVYPSQTPEYRRERYQEHGERMRAERRKKYAENADYREKIKSENRERRERNLEAVRAYDAERIANAYVNRRKREIGSCQRCGYDACLGALEWHHLDPAIKTKGDLRRLSEAKAKAELDGCVLICANCHKEHHAGMW